MASFLARRANRPWIVLAAAIAVVAVAAIALFVILQGGPKGRWMSDPKTGCKIWDDTPHPDQSVTWSGECKNGYAEGSGTALWTIKGKPEDRYEGEMRAGKMTGAGILSFPNGMRYEGAFRANDFHGTGKLTYANGDVYEGQFVDDDRSGTGTLVMKDGRRYVGGWKKDLPDGQGTLTRADGTSVSGIWKMGCLNEGNMRAALVATPRECKIY
jgi:hypothetical protein